ncbi:MAG: hypothetical protein OEV07_01180 [Gammaproteobacteria bacterium]|nr:hypothetical protein [Gammaproteobacteria bacterium]
MGKHWFKIVIAVSILGSSAGAVEITDSGQHFLADKSHEPKCLWRIQADLNADHIPEELLSLDKYRNGKAGHIWQVYIGTKGGFKVASKLISFRTGAAYIGHIQEIDEPGLLAYFPASSSQGALLSFHVKQGRLVERNLGQLRPQGSDVTMYQHYFALSNIVVEKKPLFGAECGEI